MGERALCRSRMNTYLTIILQTLHCVFCKRFGANKAFEVVFGIRRLLDVFGNNFILERATAASYHHAWFSKLPFLHVMDIMYRGKTWQNSLETTRVCSESKQAFSTLSSAAVCRCWCRSLAMILYGLQKKKKTVVSHV